MKKLLLLIFLFIGCTVTYEGTQNQIFTLDFIGNYNYTITQQQGHNTYYETGNATGKIVITNENYDMIKRSAGFISIEKLTFKSNEAFANYKIYNLKDGNVSFGINYDIELGRGLNNQHSMGDFQ